MAENMENQQYAFLKDWSTEELEQLLREDTCQDSTNQKMVDFALEVLLEREGYTKTEQASMIQKAWDDFQMHYNVPEGRGRELYPMIPPKCERKQQLVFSHFRRVSIAVALLVALMLGTTQVLGLENIFTIIGQWTNSIFYFIKYDFSPSKDAEPLDYFSDNSGMMELWSQLTENGISNVVLPTWIPERYEFKGIDKTELRSGAQIYSAYFERDSDRIAVQVKILNEAKTFTYEKDASDLEKCTINGHEYFIMYNLDVIECNWAENYWECSVIGNMSKDEIYQMIQSIK